MASWDNLPGNCGTANRQRLERASLRWSTAALSGGREALDAIDHGIVFPGIPGVEGEAVDVPNLDLESLCRGFLRSHALPFGLSNSSASCVRDAGLAN